MLETLFNDQTSMWSSIAFEHLRRVTVIIDDCNENIFDEICPDKSLLYKLRSKLEAAEAESFENAKQELTRLLSDERDGPLLTNNHYYADNLAAARADRFVNSLKKLGFEDGEEMTINFSEIKNTMHLSNQASAVYDIHDTLKAYYKVALKRFIDNVANQVIQRILLGPNGPVSIFTPAWVLNLSAEELTFIAGEDFATSNLRAELNAQISRLDKARKICSGKAVTI